MKPVGEEMRGKKKGLAGGKWVERKEGEKNKGWEKGDSHGTLGM